MLIFLKVNNCFIYNQEIEFSMRANMHFKKFPCNVIKIGKANILKTTMIIGPNNSGKTNFIKVINMIKKIMLNQKVSIVKNLFTKSDICEFTIGFLYEKKEYVFEAKYNVKENKYIYERFAKVSYDEYKNRKENNILIRDNINGIYECQDNALSVAMKVTAQNNILIYLLDTTQFKLLDNIKNIIRNFALSIDILDMNNIPMKKTIEMLKSPSEKQKKIVNFILNADLSLDDYRYLNDDELILKISPDDAFDENIKPQEKVLDLTSSLLEMLHLTSVYKGVAVPSLVFDSTGTKKIAALASYVIDALENGRILVVDELDNSLHFKLTRAIISLFNNELNKEAQLICTVHDVSLLDCQKLFRKEQIWFSHKDRDNAYLYSLAEFTSEKDKIRNTTDLIEKYRLGVFGALPDPDLFKSLLEVKNDV